MNNIATEGRFWLVLLFFWLLNSHCTSLLAQSYLFGKITGEVYESDTNQPLVGVNVILIDTEPLKGSSTDLYGEFKIENVPIGRVSLTISHIGYINKHVDNLLLTSGKDLFIKIFLQPAFEALDEIVITPETDKSKANNDLSLVSTRSFNVEETQRYAAGFNDPARMASNFAGVATFNDESNELIIRGNNPTGLLWRLDGIEIPNPNHYRDGVGSAGGGVSMIASSVLSNSDFFTGAFPAEYGNASSGVFDLSFRNGNRDKFEYSFQSGLLGIQGSAEGPLRRDNRSSFLFNYRYSTLSLLYKAGWRWEEEDSLDPEFQDINYKVQLPTKASGSFALFGFTGLSRTGESARGPGSHDDKQEFESYKTSFAGVSHTYSFKNGKTGWKSVLGYSYEYDLFKEDTVGYDRKEFNILLRKFVNNAFRFNTNLTHRFNSKVLIQGGVIYSKYCFSLLKREFADNQIDLMLNNRGRTWFFQAFVQARNQLRPKIEIVTGVHYNYLKLNEANSIEPRVAVRYSLDGKSNLSYGFGMHSKIEHFTTYLTLGTDENTGRQYPNKNIEFAKAFHHVVAINRNVSENVSIKLEAYYQYKFNVPVAADSGYYSTINGDGHSINIPLINEGKGKGKGVELSIEKYLSHGYYGLFTGSISTGTYSDRASVWRSTRYNAKYIATILGGKEWGVGKNKRNIMSINLKLFYRDGFRITPIDIEESIKSGRAVLDLKKIYDSKGPNYFRMDYGMSFRKNNYKYSWMLSFDLQNVTNRLNVHHQYFDSKDKAIKNTTHLGLIPNVNLKVDF
ncbi:MAG TPA: TonB-dependent receptor [Cyclobacteriaceae bacterium]|nr:TonB-dependent receptor [Cyclobacteriaceae bacterium]